jgi:predicted DNA-binding protein with PD1-like motif
MHTLEGQLQRVIIIRLDPGEDLLEGMERGLRERGVTHGSILSIWGSVTSYHLHTVKTTNLPPGNIFYTQQGLAYDILCGTGSILNGRLHVHLTLCDHNKAIGGHLHKGTEVLTFAVITALDLEGMDLTDLDRYTERKS